LKVKTDHKKKFSMKKFSLLALLIVLLAFSACRKPQKPVDDVNPFIGTGGHGHTFPGATVPFGMVQLSPDTRLEGWDGCSGYHYDDTVVYGFSHTHLSGTGIADYGDILLMPTTERYYFDNGYKSGTKNGYASRFDKKTEKASPGYYTVKLSDYGIKVELTATKRAGFQCYTFPEGKKAFVTLDLTHRDKVLASGFKQVDAYTIQGMRRSRSWAQDQYLYYYIQFNQPIKKLYLSVNDTLRKGQTEAHSTDIKVAFGFGKLKNHILLVKTGISAVSIDGARKNLKAEIPGWDFNRVRQQARADWEKALNKIQIKADKTTRVIFYTALYHTMIAPNLYMDIDGKYRGTDLKIHQAKDFTNYTVFSLWDTFRATHPLYTLIDRHKDLEFIRTFLHQYENGGQLPVWELAGNYTGCMIGYHSVPVIVDAWEKGIRNFDEQEAYRAMKHSAMQDHLGLSAYKKYGYIPMDKESASVSKTLEYAYDDWCIAQMAKALNKPDDYRYFIRRAQSYKNLFDPQTGFMRPKSDGIWKYPFDPTEVDFNYTEANAWQYTFFVPQDVTGLMQLMGGNQKFARKLDLLFTTKQKLSGRHQPDITGLVGQYAHGNEPSHHIAYLYDYAGQPWKTQKMVRHIMKEMYNNQPDGLAGNEDCGQMSAWYVLSAMGIYSVTPGSVIYAIGSPALQQATLHLENGKSFTIEAQNFSLQNVYIQSATLNGKPYNKSYITQQNIMQGGKLSLVMGPHPNKKWGVGKGNMPVSAITDNPIVPVPFSNAKHKVFVHSLKVRFSDVEKGVKIFYRTENDPGHFWLEQTHPIPVNKNVTFQYYAQKGLEVSDTVITRLLRFPEGRSIKLYSRPDRQYTGGSDSALIDGLYGGDDFSSGRWLGFQGIDLRADINLGRTQRIALCSARFLQNIYSWIFMPQYVTFSVSTDGKHFRRIGTVKNKVPERAQGNIIKSFTLKLPQPVRAKYVRIFAKSLGQCPPWHKGYPGKAWIFTDEVTIK
jgi:predicted alpha-1,2-mannosidase